MSQFRAVDPKRKNWSQRRREEEEDTREEDLAEKIKLEEARRGSAGRKKTGGSGRFACQQEKSHCMQQRVRVGVGVLHAIKTWVRME